MGDHCPIQPTKGAMTGQAARVRAGFVNKDAHRLMHEGKYEEAWKLQDEISRAAGMAHIPGERGGSTYRKEQILISPNEEKPKEGGNIAVPSPSRSSY